MASTSLAQLVVEISANSAAFRSELEKARGQFGQFTSAIKTGLATLGTAASVAGLSAMVKSALDAGAATREMAARMGIGTRELQELQHAARDTGINLDALETGIRNLSRNLDEAANDSASAREAFARLGVSWRDSMGNVRDVVDVLNDAADALNLKGQAERAALAIQLFGRSGTALLPLLNEGAKGMAAMRQESQRTGQVLSNEVLKSLDDTQDSFDKAAHSIKAGFMKAVAESKPLLVGFSEMLQKVGIDLDAVAQKATDWRLGERLRVILGLGMIKPIPEPEVFGPPSPPGEVFGPPLPPKGAPQLTIAQRIQMAQAAAAAAQNRLAIAGAASLAGPGSEVDLLQRQITLSQQKVRVDLDGLAAQRALELTDKGRLELAQKQEKVVTDFIIEQIRLTKELTDLERQHQQQIDAGTVSAVEAQLAEEEATDAAIRALQELDRLADQDAQAKIRAGWVEAAEAVIEYEDAVRRAYEQQDRLRFDERMKEIQAGTGPIFESLNRALSGTVTGILQGTQTLQQAFANMGRNIAASLIENVIQKGLAVLQKALDDFLESLIRSGLIQQTARAGVGLLTSLLGAGASPGTLDAGGALAAAGGLGAYPYASGGLVTRPTLGLIGEGGPEVVIPLKDGAVPVSGGWGGGRTEIHIHNNTNATVEHTESRGPDGRVIHDVVIGEVRRAIQSGEMDKILSPYALSRQPVRR